MIIKRKILLILMIVAVATLSASNKLPKWVECDSVDAIQMRLRSDFSLTMEQASSQIKKLYPQLTDINMRCCIENHYLETMIIEGEEMMHRKSPRNLKLLNPEIRGGWKGRGCEASEREIAIVDSIIEHSKGEGDKSNSCIIKYRFSIDVPRHDFLIGDTLRVWMPLPINSERQKQVKILSSIPNKYIISTGQNSLHNTIYFEIPVTQNSDSILHFEYIGEYCASAQYFSQEYIMKNIKAYDKSSDLYKKYTAVELPHIIKDSLAYEIVGEETSPYRQSEMIYDYIVKNYPWAGAREYSTIECIPEYVLRERHGDCGQVALLYISLMRTLGVPARWESGWMLHPGDKNLHDWAEVYFEGIGWVPVDVSFGRYSASKNNKVVNFYSTGMDYYRFATNKGICSSLYPRKRYVRSETVDFQMGEVECSKGNLFYPGWDNNLEIISIKPVGDINKVNDVINEVKRKCAPDKRQVVYDISASIDNGKTIVKGKTSEQSIKEQLLNAFKDADFEVVDSVEVLLSDKWGQVKISVACFRVNPGHSSEMATQGIMGMPVRLLEKKGDWWLAQMPDGYIAYVINNSLVEKSEKQMAQWRNKDRVVVTSLGQTYVYKYPTNTSVRNIVSDVVNGVILDGTYSDDTEYIKVTLPDGRCGYIKTADVTPIKKWASQEFNHNLILDVAYSMEGAPYLWGGTSTKSLDCSGLAKVSYFANGIILMRDASQQATTGQIISAQDWRKCKAGDLLFFGNAKTRRVTHVGIYDHDGKYVHSSGRVKRNSIDPESKMYLNTPFLHATRIDGKEGTFGIVKACEHKWYFD